MPAEDATWEAELLKSQFTFFSLEDKAIAEGGSNDDMMLNIDPVVGSDENVLVGLNQNRPKVWRVYEREIK